MEGTHLMSVQVVTIFIKSAYIKVDLQTHKRVVLIEISWDPVSPIRSLYPLYGHCRLKRLDSNLRHCNRPKKITEISSFIQEIKCFFAKICFKFASNFLFFFSFFAEKTLKMTI